MNNRGWSQSASMSGFGASHRCLKFTVKENTGGQRLAAHKSAFVAPYDILEPASLLRLELLPSKIVSNCLLLNYQNLVWT
jgi:hypothetical protein